MKKIIVGFTSIILILFSSSQHGQAQSDMVCTISQAVDANCTPHLVLEYGDLTISEKNSFALHGRYTACHHRQEVSITGRVKRFSYPDAVDLELLATETQILPTITQLFPRTIGTVTLKKASLEGYFFDVWTSIRTRGMYQQDPFTRIIRCKIIQ